MEEKKPLEIPVGYKERSTEIVEQEIEEKKVLIRRNIYKRILQKSSSEAKAKLTEVLVLMESFSVIETYQEKAVTFEVIFPEKTASLLAHILMIDEKIKEKQKEKIAHEASLKNPVKNNKGQNFTIEKISTLMEELEESIKAEKDANNKKIWINEKNDLLKLKEDLETKDKETKKSIEKINVEIKSLTEDLFSDEIETNVIPESIEAIAQRITKAEKFLWVERIKEATAPKQKRASKQEKMHLESARKKNLRANKATQEKKRLEIEKKKEKSIAVPISVSVVLLASLITMIVLSGKKEEINKKEPEKKNLVSKNDIIVEKLSKELKDIKVQTHLEASLELNKYLLRLQGRFPDKNSFKEIIPTFARLYNVIIDSNNMKRSGTLQSRFNINKKTGIFSNILMTPDSKVFSEAEIRRFWTNGPIIPEEEKEKREKINKAEQKLLLTKVSTVKEAREAIKTFENEFEELHFSKKYTDHILFVILSKNRKRLEENDPENLTQALKTPIIIGHQQVQLIFESDQDLVEWFEYEQEILLEKLNNIPFQTHRDLFEIEQQAINFVLNLPISEEQKNILGQPENFASFCDKVFKKHSILDYYPGQVKGFKRTLEGRKSTLELIRD